MHNLFPSLRSDLVNAQCAIVSNQSLRIFELLHEAKGPVRAKQLQEMLLLIGEDWAEGRAGYMAIWSLLHRLQQAGVLVHKGQQGFMLASEWAIVNIFAGALLEVVKENLPGEGPLGELRGELARVVTRFAFRATKAS